MKAVLYAGKDTIAVKDVDMPENQSGQILIKMHNASICGT